MPTLMDKQEPQGLAPSTRHMDGRLDFPALPVIEELSPQLNPAEILRKLASLPFPIFFDSVQRHPLLGHYSYLSADPFEWITSRRGTVNFASRNSSLEADPFLVLHTELERYRTRTIPGLPLFQGGAAGLFGYDLCHHIERLPRPLVDEFEVPDLAIGLYDWVLAFDHVADRCWLISTGFPEVDLDARSHRAGRRMLQVKRWLEGPAPALVQGRTMRQVLPTCQWPTSAHQSLTSSFSRDAYMQAVRRAIEYVHAGDCFQVNLSQRLLYPSEMHPAELYLRLRERNPAPFAGYFDLGEFAIASASPERFLLALDGQVETRPIKGTRQRGATDIQERELIAELLSSAKDRAENIMIVDLLRNDLGRVCRYGSIDVSAVCRLESFAYVHHLVSEVRGQLRAGLGPMDLLRAAFPGGSVTGAPKIRAMEIISELEPTTRGPYCGSLGFVGFDQSMDTSILIRTFTIGKGWVQFSVGGGIVADSDPTREYEETWHKAEGLLRAL